MLIAGNTGVSGITGSVATDTGVSGAAGTAELIGVVEVIAGTLNAATGDTGITGSVATDTGVSGDAGTIGLAGIVAVIAGTLNAAMGEARIRLLPGNPSRSLLLGCSVSIGRRRAFVGKEECVDTGKGDFLSVVPTSTVKSEAAVESLPEDSALCKAARDSMNKAYPVQGNAASPRRSGSCASTSTISASDLSAIRSLSVSLSSSCKANSEGTA